MKPRTSVWRGSVVAAVLAALLTPGHGLVSAPAVAEAATDTGSPALSPSAAQAKAEKSGEAVEILSLRDERSTTVANPDGTFTTKEYVQPVRTRKNGEWTDIDTTLVRQQNGTITPKAALSAMTFSGGGDPTFASIEKDGRALSIDWPGKLPKPKLDGSTATYADVLPDVDLKVTASAEGFSHVLVVKTKKAAANPDLASLELPVDATSLEVAEDSAGGLTATDTGAGGTVFEAPQPLMWDSSHESDSDSQETTDTTAQITPDATPPQGSQVADVSLDVSADVLTLTPDQDLFTDADTVYPVYIDPVVKTANRSAWTLVSSYYSGSSFWKFDDDEGVGKCPSDVSALCASATDIKRQFFAVPTGGFEDKDIVDAQFAVTQVFTYSSAAREVQLSRVNSSGASAINSGTTWSNQPSSKETIGSKSPTDNAGSCTSTNQNVRFDVTSTVQKAADNGWDTTTFRLKAGSESDTSYWKRFCGNAHLEVTYNRPPLQPEQDDLQMKPGGSCEYGAATEHYVTEAPRVSAVIKDYDHHDTGSNTETLQAQFKVWWTNSSGDEVVHTATTAKKTTVGVTKGSQTGQQTFYYTIGSDVSGDGQAGFTIPSNTTVAWAVRGYDQESYGPWSTDGTQSRCEFIYDTSKPKSATITSTGYPDDEAWHAGVGDYGDFTMDSTSADVTSYSYYFTGPQADNTKKKVAAQSTGGPATVRWMPPSEGSYTLHVTAIDGAGNPQKTPTSHVFLVDDGRAPVAAWTLGDTRGSTKAAGRSGGTPDATAGSGVTFGDEGPLGSTDTAAFFDGTENAYLDAGAPAVDTGSTFSVSAWVKLPEKPTSNMTVVSQDGTGQPGFELGYDVDSASWTFRIPVSDMEALGTWKVSGAKAVVGSWTHLIGVYDEELGKMMLYVNGTLVADDVQARQTVWTSSGPLQVGRRLDLDGYTAALKGSVADVKMYDRVVPPVEGQEIGGIQPHQLSYWQLDEDTSGVSPETAGNTGLTLGGGASIYVPDESCDPQADPDCTESSAQPLGGDGHLTLNGTDGYATRAATGPLTARDSFTLTARARLASASSTADQTVLALSGVNGSAIKVKYSAAEARWKLVVTDADTAAPVTTTLLDANDQPSGEGDGDHLALVYNAVFGDVLLYVNGVAVADAVWDNVWDFSTTSLQVGRTLDGTTAGEYFSGAVDEVRMYQGPLDASLVTLVAVMPAGASIEEGTSG